jgi:hypothetical protein
MFTDSGHLRTALVVTPTSSPTVMSPPITALAPKYSSSAVTSLLIN